MIIELYGLPGSGKTTLARKVCSLHSGVDRVVFTTKGQVMMYFVRGCIRRPLLNIRGAILWFQYSEQRLSFWNFYFVRYAKYHKATLSKAPYCILDEGLHQNVISYSRSVYSLEQLQHFLNWIPKVETILIFSLPEDIRHKQIQQRIEQAIRPKEYNKNRELIMLSNDRSFRALCAGSTSYAVTTSTDEALKSLFAAIEK